MDSKNFSEELEIALSGGGFRATAFGLGVLLYLADSGLNQRVKTISSVSGGSITNGFVASECDFGSLTDSSTFRHVAARLAKIVSGRGKYQGFWLASRPYLTFMFTIGAIIMAWFLNMFAALLALFFWKVELRPISRNEIILFLVVGVVWGVAALLRGDLVLWWISRTFLHSTPITLGSLSERKIDHVFCATDLTSSRPFFFSTKGGGRIFSENYGRGEGKDVPLKMAAATSAAFPPLIPAFRFKTADRQFIGGESPPVYIYLSDGGVWNNLGTDWSRLRSSVLTAEIAWSKRTTPNWTAKNLPAVSKNCPMAGVLLIANASQPEKKKNLWMLKIPMLSFLITLIRVINVTVNSTVRARSVDIERTARLRMLNNPERWELEDAPLPTSTVWGEGVGTDPPLAVVTEMTRKPGETANAWRMIGGLAQWVEKPDEYQRELEVQLQELKPLFDWDDVIPTTLDNLGPRRTLKMIVLGYLTTRETLAVAFKSHAPPPIPTRKWFEELLEPGQIG